MRLAIVEVLIRAGACWRLEIPSGGSAVLSLRRGPYPTGLRYFLSPKRFSRSLRGSVLEGAFFPRITRNECRFCLNSLMTLLKSHPRSRALLY